MSQIPQDKFMRDMEWKVGISLRLRNDICKKPWLVKKGGTNYFSKFETTEGPQGLIGDEVQM